MQTSDSCITRVDVFKWDDAKSGPVFRLSISSSTDFKKSAFSDKSPWGGIIWSEMCKIPQNSRYVKVYLLKIIALYSIYAMLFPSLNMFMFDRSVIFDLVPVTSTLNVTFT